MAELQLIIRSWKEYNYRPDIKHPNWFRLNHRLFEDPDFYNFSHGELIAWIYILCEASKKNNETGKITVNSEHAHRVANIDFTVLNSAIKKLKQKQILEVRTLRGRYADVVDACATRQDMTRQNITKEKKAGSALFEPSPVFDFDSLYQLYPRKDGRKKGIEICMRRVKTPAQFDDLRSAILNYASKTRETEKKYIKQFSTFMNCYEDYIQIEATDLSREDRLKQIDEQIEREKRDAEAI